MRKTQRGFSMKKLFRTLGTIAMLAVFLLSFAACDGFDLDNLVGGITGGGSTGDGTITITDIPPEYNGKYAMFQGIYESQSGRAYLTGVKSINVLTQVITLAPISNGRVSLSVWKLPDDNPANFARYSGSDNVMGAIGIFDSATVSVNDQPVPVFTINFDSIQFSNGSAAKSFNDAKDNSLIPGSGEGTLIVTDIPSEYNGKFVMFSGFYISYSSGVAVVDLIGIHSYNASTQVVTLPGISDGKVSLSVWMTADNGYIGYSGSDDVDGTMVIVDSATVKSGDNNQPVVRIKFNSISFSNGSAAVSWSYGEEE
jgi:hypothetical protein